MIFLDAFFFHAISLMNAIEEKIVPKEVLDRRRRNAKDVLIILGLVLAILFFIIL